MFTPKLRYRLYQPDDTAARCGGFIPTTVYRVTTSYVGGHGADGRRGPRLPVERTEVPVGRLRDPALFAPWRVMWRPVFPGCHTHSGGFAIHVGRSCALGADNGNRTHLRGLGSRRSADELYPRCCPAGVAPGHRSENGERVLTGHAWKVGEYYVRHPRRW